MLLTLSADAMLWIIGIVIPCVLLLVVAGVLFYMWRTKRMECHKEPP
jgi:hypothetical protein